ncbi:MAG: sulfate permease [bacterium]
MAASELEPKLVTVLREGYSRAQFLQDVVAGVIVGIVALPLAIAFAIASGVKPEQGLVTAIVAGLLISALGGSRVQIGGPTGAFVVLVYGIVREFGPDGLAVATMLAGALLVVLGLVRLGTVIRFIPYPVTVGFTSGIAVIIGIGQMRDALGLQMDAVPAEFAPKVAALGSALGTMQPTTVAFTVGTIVVITMWPRRWSRVPGSLVALVASAVLAHAFHLPVETIGDRFGSVGSSLPRPHLPVVDWALLPRLFSPALAIALLGGIESLLSAVVADGMTGRRHRSNVELVAQGFANVITPLFGGIPATGAIARTATNVRSGGRTPVAGIVHSITLLVILLVAGPQAAMIPLASLAGILLVVAWRMGEWHLFLQIFRSTRSDLFVLLSTFLLTVFVDLTIAIQSGVVFAALLFMRRMAEMTEVKSITDLTGDDERDDAPGAPSPDVPADVQIFEIQGPFFFGAAHKFRHTLDRIATSPRVLVLRLRQVPTMDATGLRALEEVLAQCRRSGTTLVLSGVHPQPRALLARSGFLDQLGPDRVFADLAAALRWIRG